MPIQLTELTSNQGNIAKQYSINPDGSYQVKSAPVIFDATSKTISLELCDVAKYFDGLADAITKCILLGIHGSVGEEYQLTTTANVTEGKIARSTEFFNWANGGSVSLLMLDFDAPASAEKRQQFLNELDVVLSDCLIGEDTESRNKICKWIRPSTSASVEINGKQGTGLHVFIPVKKCNSKILPLLHKYCWLHNHKSHRITASGIVLPESLIDGAVGSPERVIYTSDAEVLGPEEFFTRVERKCKYHPGGVLDAELLEASLRELTYDYDREWRAYKAGQESSPAVIEARNAFRKKKEAKYIAEGANPKRAKSLAQNLSNQVLLSDFVLKRTDGSEVSVREILEDPDNWMGKDKFNDPVKAESHRNVGKIMGSSVSPFLYSFSHGGVKYALKWHVDDLTDWVERSSKDEVLDMFGTHLVNLQAEEMQAESLIKVVSKKIDVSISSIKATKKNKIAEVAAEPGVVVDNASIPCVTLSDKATHGDIIDDYIRRAGDCRIFGDTLYSWEGGSIWQNHSKGYIREKIRNLYNHVKVCTQVSHYSGLAKAILEEERLIVSEWPEPIGFPCSDGFYTVSVDGFDKQDYAKELYCRFKMKVKPDFHMRTPNFDKVIANVNNPVLYQQLFGLALGGYLTKMQTIFMMKGEGGSGKGTTNTILTAMLPKKRLSHFTLPDLNDNVFRSQLADVRINFTDEVDKDKRFSLRSLLEMSGGGDIAGRGLYKDPTEFKASCSFIICMNNFFPLSTVGRETERRFGSSIVEFKAREKDAAADFDLANKIIDKELPGVLAWAMEGVRLYLEYGLEDELSRKLYREWTISVDPVELFIDECIEFTHKRDYLERPEIWKRFQQFCIDGEYKPIRKGDFFSQFLKDHRFSDPAKVHGVVRLFGARWCK